MDQYGTEVFKDIDSIELGDDFVEVINKAVGSCDVLLALIGEEWLTITDDRGTRRLDDPDDYVRLEIEAALARQVRVIPILIDGATMPRAEQLPDSLAGLVRRQALELSPSRFDFDTSRLLKVLDKTLTAIRTPAEPSQAPAHESPRGPTVEPMAPAPGAAPGTEGAEVGPAPPPSAPPTERPRAPRRRGVLIAAAVVAALILAGLAIAILSGGEGGGVRATVPIDLPTGAGPDGMAIDGNVMWITDQDRGRLWRVDLETYDVRHPPIDVGNDPDGVAVGYGAVWVANVEDSTVTRLEVSDDGAMTGRDGVEIPPIARTRPEEIALGGGSVWVATGPTGQVMRIDPESRTLSERIDVGTSALGVLVDEDQEAVYVSDRVEDSVTRLDMSTGDKVWGPKDVGDKPRTMVEAEGSVWVANSGAGSVSRIDADSGDVLEERVLVGENPRDVAYADGFIWVANTASHSVTQIDARTADVVEEIEVGNLPASVIAGAGAVWVSNSADGTVSRIEP